MDGSAELDRLHARIAGRFARSEPRARARQYLFGLVSGPPRKNAGTLAARAGDVSPDGMQRLLRRADWDVDGVRDDVRDYVVERLGDRRSVLIVTDTGFAKKGVKSAGVAHQHAGSGGHVENCQVGVFLAYASATGHALIDRELYLPREWTDDRARCRAAGIGDDVAFATRARLAQQMLARTFAAGIRPECVTMDRVYATSGSLRAWLQTNRQAYVLDDELAGRTLRRARDDAGLDQYQVRDWRAWHAHITLSMAALAALVVAETEAETDALPPPDQ